MQSSQENKMSKEEIIKYVDDLIKANKRAYDKRLSPLLYEFFLRANKKFEWSRKEFLEKYQNFRNNVKEIKITDMKKVGMPSFWTGGFSYGEKKGIYLNEKYIENVKNEPTEKNIDVYIIDTLFHECLHATDLTMENEDIKQYGLYHSGNNNEGDTMLNEYANVLSSTLISSNKTMYTDNCGIDFTNNGSYENLKCPGEIICAALDITEPQLAKLKDKGGDLFYEYLQDKFPYVDIEDTLDVFKSSLNVIYNASMSKDKENISLGLKNMIDAASNLISSRLDFIKWKDKKEALETLERIYYDIYKCGKIVKSVDRIYELEGNNKVFNSDTLSVGEGLVKRVKVYNRFLNNEDLFTLQEKILIESSINPEKLIESKFDDDYIDLEFDIEEIVRKYYPQSNDPLNDNTKLIEYVKETILKPTIKENISKAISIESEEISKLEKLEKSEMPDIERTEKLTTKEQEAANFRNSIKYEKTIIHNRSEEKEEQPHISRGDEESMREE